MFPYLRSAPRGLWTHSDSVISTTICAFCQSSIDIKTEYFKIVIRCVACWLVDGATVKSKADGDDGKYAFILFVNICQSFLALAVAKQRNDGTFSMSLSAVLHC